MKKQRFIMFNLVMGILALCLAFSLAPGANAKEKGKVKKNLAVAVEKLRPFTKLMGLYFQDAEGAGSLDLVREGKTGDNFHGDIKSFTILFNGNKDFMVITLSFERPNGKTGELSFGLTYCSVHKSWEIGLTDKKIKDFTPNQVTLISEKDKSLSGYGWGKITGKPARGRFILMWWNEKEKKLQLSIKWYVGKDKLKTDMIWFKKIA